MGCQGRRNPTKRNHSVLFVTPLVGVALPFLTHGIYSQLSLRPGNVPPRTSSGVTCSTDTDASLPKLAIGLFRSSSVRYCVPYRDAFQHRLTKYYSYSLLQVIQHTHGPRSTMFTSTAKRATLLKLESTKYRPVNSQ